IDLVGRGQGRRGQPRRPRAQCVKPPRSGRDRLLSWSFLGAFVGQLRGARNIPMKTRSVRPVVLRDAIEIQDPLGVVLAFLQAHWRRDVNGPSGAASFGESDLRLANRGGARISASEIATILGRRRKIERALAAIALDASLAGAAKSVPWLALRQLFAAF